MHSDQSHPLYTPLGAPSSWSRLLEEATKPGRGVTIILLSHALCNRSTPFFLRMAQSIPLYLPFVLVALLGTEHFMNGDCSSFCQDLGIYLKTIGDDREVIETFTFVCLAEKDVPPSLFSSFWS